MIRHWSSHKRMIAFNVIWQRKLASMELRTWGENLLNEEILQWTLETKSYKA